MACEEIELAVKKGKSTPAPGAYKCEKLKFLPEIGKLGMSIAE